MEDLLQTRLNEHAETILAMQQNWSSCNEFCCLAERIIQIITEGGKILLCGNGGSASDSLHMASELVGRFCKNRRPIAAIALNSDVSTITAISNDFGYEHVFSRQVEALGTSSDLLIVFSSTGNSKNLIEAVSLAREKGLTTAAFLGDKGNQLEGLVNYPILVPASITANIQESHIILIHIICEYIESKLE